MAKFVYVYTGGDRAQTPEAQEQAMAAWGAWFETLGGVVVDMGSPFGASTVVTDRATGGSGAAGGYSILEATSLEDAASKAKGCPILEVGGSVEVYEAVEM
jgi:hypothetical protein